MTLRLKRWKGILSYTVLVTLGGFLGAGIVALVMGSEFSLNRNFLLPFLFSMYASGYIVIFQLPREVVCDTAGIRFESRHGLARSWYWTDLESYKLPRFIGPAKLRFRDGDQPRCIVPWLAYSRSDWQAFTAFLRQNFPDKEANARPKHQPSSTPAAT